MGVMVKTMKLSGGNVAIIKLNENEQLQVLAFQYS
jgi:hypothetical protein